MIRRPIAKLRESEMLFYDIETDHQYAPYTTLKMIGYQIGLRGKRKLAMVAGQATEHHPEFLATLQKEEVLKFGWNSMSFDNIVLRRYDYVIPEANLHDLMLVFKTIAPQLPSYSLKFCNWYYFNDPHFPEMELERWAMKNDRDKWEGPPELVGPYCLHDIFQTKEMFRLGWDHVIKQEHWDAYLLDISQGEPVQEMMMEGGVVLDSVDLTKRIATLQYARLGWEQEAYIVSKGRVENPNSAQQLGRYLASEGFVLDLTNSGEYSVPKEELLDIIDLEDESRDQDRVARCAYEVRKINSSLKYFENYLEALNHCPDHFERGWIPLSLSISNARTRRYTSGSLYGLNFQNPNEAAKSVQLVPQGYLGVWLDSTQVENVVHIYESADRDRRLAYTLDPDWNEYVWLANQILGGNRSKKELDSIPSPQVPHWTVYKQWKTCKLSLNFGMGYAMFCKRAGIEETIGKRLFETVHEACPAIHRLQHRIAHDLQTKGKVTDVFGHIYTGNIRKAYKVVAYLIQGTGTASLPKVQIRSNYNTIHEFDEHLTTGPLHPAGHLCGTTHDENALRLRLDLGSDTIIAILQKLMFNMTDKYSHKFDGIPLRAKLYLSRTTAKEAQEVKIEDLDTIKSFCI